MGCNSTTISSDSTVCESSEGDTLVLNLSLFKQSIHHDVRMLDYCRCNFKNGDDETELIITREALGLPDLQEDEFEKILSGSTHAGRKQELEAKYDEEARSRPQRLAKVKVGKNTDHTRTVFGVWRRTEVTILEEIRGV